MNALVPVAQKELVKQYFGALDRFQAYSAALGRIVAEDFPAKDAPEGGITRYHLDAMRDLTNRLAAMVDGWDGMG